MRINLSPVFSTGQSRLTVTRAEDVLTIDGETFDFSSVPNGGTIPASVVPCPSIEGSIERVAGELRLTLIMPHGLTPSETVAFPAPLIDPPDGALVLPADNEEPADVDA